MKLNSGTFEGLKNDLLYIIPLIAVYAIIVISSLDHVYFWDNVQQTSKEAHWFYQQSFSRLWLPGFSEGQEIVGTAYHFPLIGMMTAALWMIFGKHLWVSHIFIGLWSLLLIYYARKLFRYYLPIQIVGLALLVLLLESTLLTQIAIASPDVILLTAMLMALCGIVGRRRGLTAIALLFLVLINGRGMLCGILVYVFALLHRRYVDKESFNFNILLRTALPFIPAFFIYGLYLSLYLLKNGWFLNNPDSPWVEGWQGPQGWFAYFKNLASFCLRLLENGRFVIWLAALAFIAHAIKNKRHLLETKELPLLALIVMLLALFVYFALTTQLVIGSRYYMGITLMMGLLVFAYANRLWHKRKLKLYALLLLLMFAGGHFWIYPDRIAKAWDATLAHQPYYTLREQMLDYLNQSNIKPEKVGGGGLFSGNHRYIDLKDRDLLISSQADKDYFIYSNLSNLSDEFIDEFENPELWKEIKTWRKGYVFISLLQNQSLNNNE